MTFSAILQAATDVIVERGMAALNTNAVADRAGVNVGTLYHYFPDKYAILKELFELHEDEWTGPLMAQVNSLDGARDLTEWCRDLLARLRDHRRKHPTARALRRAFLSVPELASRDEINSTAVARAQRRAPTTKRSARREAGPVCGTTRRRRAGCP